MCLKYSIHCTPVILLFVVKKKNDVMNTMKSHFIFSADPNESMAMRTIRFTTDYCIPFLVICENIIVFFFFFFCSYSHSYIRPKHTQGTVNIRWYSWDYFVQPHNNTLNVYASVLCIKVFFCFAFNFITNFFMNRFHSGRQSYYDVGWIEYLNNALVE